MARRGRNRAGTRHRDAGANPPGPGTTCSTTTWHERESLADLSSASHTRGGPLEEGYLATAKAEEFEPPPVRVTPSLSGSFRQPGSTSSGSKRFGYPPPVTRPWSMEPRGRAASLIHSILCLLLCKKWNAEVRRVTQRTQRRAAALVVPLRTSAFHSLPSKSRGNSAAQITHSPKGGRAMFDYTKHVSTRLRRLVGYRSPR